MPGNWSLRGWRMDPRTPSTLDLGAANWLARVVRNEPTDALLRLHEAAKPLFSANQTSVGDLRSVHEAYIKRREATTVLNSSALFNHVLDNRKECPNQAAVREMKRAIKALQIKEPPSPFYAILLMDGDSLGELLRESGSAVSNALDRFTRQVPDIVNRHNGFLIYAGGDDVLALLPLENALECAAVVRQCYLDAFAAKNLESTISAAVEYAHVKMPLTRILGDAHHLLNDIAKEGRGRDAIAVRVWKPGGQALEWAMPWMRALAPHPHRPPQGGREHSLKIEQLAEQFAGDESAAQGKDADRFSSKFFYKIRERFDLLNPQRSKPGHREEAAIFKDDDALSLLAVDYLASGINEGRKPKLTLPDAKRIIQPLLEQCRTVIRHKNESTVSFSISNRLEADGALLVRFLARKGVER
jgi:CRISPR-associated protein Cmr2